MKPRVIELTQGYVAVVSGADFLRVSRYSWHVHMSRGSNKKPGQPYARANIKGKKVYLHRFILGACPTKHVDHANHQTLDNRRSNLEVVTPKVNARRRRNSNPKLRE